MTDKILEAVKWISRGHTGPPLQADSVQEILELADLRHRKRFGRAIFTENINLAGLPLGGYEDTGRCYGWTLDADEKRFLSKSYAFLTS